MTAVGYLASVHKKCSECGKFVPKDRWVEPIFEQFKKQRASTHWIRTYFPLCRSCQREGE